MAFSFFNNYFLTIDIGFKLIKVLQVRKKEDDAIEVVNFGIGNTPKDCIKNGAIRNKARVIEEIKRLMRENNITAKEAKIVMSGTNIITRIIMIDDVPENEVEKRVMTEIESFMPINMKEHRVDFKILDYFYEGGIKKHRIFVTAVKQSIINSYVEILNSLNLKPVAVDTPANSIAKLFNNEIWLKKTDDRISVQRNQRFDTGTVAVLDFGSETTIVNILRNKVIEFNRVILIGSSNIDKAIFDNIIIDKLKADFAEMYKKKYGIILNRDYNNDLEWNCSEITKGVVNEIIKNINTCFDFYTTRCGGDKVTKILITGGGSQLIHLNEYLEGIFKVPCYLINSVDIPGVEFAVNLDVNRINYLTNALGIAL